MKATQDAGAEKCETEVCLLVYVGLNSAVLEASEMSAPHDRSFNTISVNC